MHSLLRPIGLALLVLGIGVLRALPTLPGLPRPWSHPLGLVALLLFVVWVAARSDGYRLRVLPLLGALVAEGWIRLAFLNPAFEALLAPHLSERAADSLYHLLAAVWLGLVVWGFARGAGIRLFPALAPRHWRRGLYLHTLSVLFVYGLLSVMLQAVQGFRGLALQVPIYPTAALWVLAGQTALCVGEEVFYRGFLLSAVAQALRRGPGDERGSASMAVWLSSALFALDHLRGMPWGLSLLMTGLYTLLLGLLLALLVRLTGNLALPTLAHLFHNLMVLRLGLSVSDPRGLVWFEAMTYISLYFIITFSILYLMRRPAWAALRRTLADAT